MVRIIFFRNTSDGRKESLGWPLPSSLKREGDTTDVDINYTDHSWVFFPILVQESLDLHLSLSIFLRSKRFGNLSENF